MLYIITVGDNVRISPKDVNIIITDTHNLWNKKYYLRDMNRFDYMNKQFFYESRYNQYIVEKNLIEKEYSENDRRKIDYLVFTTDPIVFNICRFLLKKYQHSGKLIVYYNYDNNVKNYVCDSYDIDENGGLDEWPSEINNICSPMDILLSELR